MDADSLFTYPHADNLSASSQPIRMGSGVVRALAAPSVVGVLQHLKAAIGVSPACRISNDAIPPPINGVQAMTHEFWANRQLMGRVVRA